MKRTLTLLVALILLVTATLPLPALAAELPDCFVPTTMMMRFNTRLPTQFRMMGESNPASATTKYMLSNPELSSDGMRFSSEDGKVALEIQGASSGGFAPTAPAGSLTLTIAGSVSPLDAIVLKQAFLGVVADSDGAASYENLLAWLPEMSRDSDLPLSGYTLSYRHAGAAQRLSIAAGDSGKADPGPAATAAPAPTATPMSKATATPAPAGTAGLPECFVPQTAALHFNNLLGPTLEMLGAPDPGTLAEQYRLSKAQIVGDVLFLSSADGRVEINAYFEDGQPAVDRQATTLGLAMAKDVSRSELLSLGATFALAISETDSSIGDFESLLDWMSDSADGSDSAIRPMNGYSMVYAKGENGYIFTLVPDGVSQPAAVPATAAPATAAPTAEPTAAPTPAKSLPRSLEDAFMVYNGLWIELVDSRPSSGDLWLYFRVLNTSDELMRVQVTNATVNSVPVYATSVGNVDARTDSPSEDCLLTPLTDSKEEGEAALANPRSIGMTVVIKDKDYRELTSQYITIDPADLSVKLTSAPAATVKPRATAKPSATAKPYYYQSLAKGDRGEEVRRLQQRLIALGYLSDTADGQFGPKTAAAVRAFNEANGFGSSEVASVSMQEKLFSSSAKAWSEPWIPVEVPRVEWRDTKVEGSSYRVKIQNTSKTRTIKGIELCYYPTDVWGNNLWSYSNRASTFKVNIKPGKTGWTSWFYMTPSRYNIDQIHIGVSKVAFSDGTVHESSSVTYDWYVSVR